MRRPAATETMMPRPHVSPARRAHLDRFVVERLRSVVVAARHGDVGKDEQRAGTLDVPSSAGIGRVSRLQTTRGSLLVVAQFKRGKRLHEQCERDGPCITGLTAQRQRLVSAYPDFDVTPLEVMHVSQTDERPRPQRWRPVTSSRAPVRATAFPPRTDRASSRTRTARRQVRRPFSARDADVNAHSSAARTFSSSIWIRWRHCS